MRRFLIGLVAALVVTAHAGAADRPPNVVVIFADDLGYGDLSCYGATKLKTPNIDRLASEGRRFTDAHSASAVCTPSRYALITGRYPFRKGLSRPVFLRTGLVIDQERTTLADVMKNAGYSTACIGKWHLGFGGKTPDWNGDLKPGPLELGFDYYYGVPVVNSHPPFVYVENHRVVGLVPEDPFVYGKKAKTQIIEEKMIRDIGGADAAHALYDDYAVGTRMAEKSVEWIEKNKDDPFFLYLSTTNIHHPFTPAKRFQGTSECGLYGDFVHELDWIVGEVMATLEENGLAENTLVIFTSDNGGMINMTGQRAIKQGHKLNGDLLGFKFDGWEGGHRVPFIARWPGEIEAGSESRQLICNVDLLATMAALTGQDLKKGEGPDSFNVLPAFTSDPKDPIRDHLVLGASKASHLVYRDGDWALIAGKGGGGFSSAKVGSHTFGGAPALKFAGQTNSDVVDGKIKPDAPASQLYDLSADRSQSTNVIDRYPDRAQSMRASLNRIKASTGTRPGHGEGANAGVPATPVLAPGTKNPAALPGQIIEGEDMKASAKSGTVKKQRVVMKGEKWSGDAQSFWLNGKVGDTLEYSLPVAEAGSYEIAAAMTKAPDYAIVQFELDGNPLSEPVDLYHNEVIHFGPISLGTVVNLNEGNHTLTVTITGANPAARKKHGFGLDYVVLRDPNAPAIPAAKAPKPSVPPASRNSLKEGNAPDAEPLAPAEQLSKFVVPEGFVVELVASEETGLANPTSIAFDDAGRLWATTAVEYPHDRDPERWKKPGKDRIVVIDQPHLREVQPLRTFADGLVMPMSVLPHRDGAIVALGPEIVFLNDANHDGKATGRSVLLTGFGVQDTHTLPHQLVRSPGGRVTFSQGVLNSGIITDADGKSHPFNKTLIASMTPQGRDFRIIGTGMNNIWAWAQNRVGRVFIHEANDFGHSLTPFEEDSSYRSFRFSQMHPRAPIHPPTAPDLNLGGTGFSGIAISDDRSGSFPAPWKGKFFVANPITRSINAASGTLGEDEVWQFQKEENLLACEDPMFRPVAVSFGPDGCLYIVDWYNRIISHNEVANDHPARDTEHGRIWRVRHESQSLAEVTDYTQLPTGELPAALRSESTWAMRAAWHQMADRQELSVVPELATMLKDEQTAVDVRIHALWTLEELGHFDPALWKQLLTQADADLRREAVRALQTFPIPFEQGALLLQCLAEETSWSVRYEVLRYFRRGEGPVPSEALAWLREWKDASAPQNKTKDGKYLALDGSYQNAFQDFLFMLAETKTQLPVLSESKWSKVIGKNKDVKDPKEVADRIAAVKAALPGADPAKGELITQTLCLTCHAIGEEGVGFAPPLDGSAGRELDGLITAIVDPDAAIENVFRNYRIETTKGDVFEGFNQAEDRGGITLLTMGGARQVVPLKSIKKAGYIEGKSAMLDVTGGMTADQVAEIVTYLRSLN